MGRWFEGRVRTALMRKSLKEAPPALENIDPVAVVGVGAAAAAAAKFVADGGISFDVRTPPRDDIGDLAARRSSTDDATTITPSLNTLSS